MTAVDSMLCSEGYAVGEVTSISAIGQGSGVGNTAMSNGAGIRTMDEGSGISTVGERSGVCSMGKRSGIATIGKRSGDSTMSVSQGSGIYYWGYNGSMSDGSMGNQGGVFADDGVESRVTIIGVVDSALGAVRFEQ